MSLGNNQILQCNCLILLNTAFLQVMPDENFSMKVDNYNIERFCVAEAFPLASS